MRWFQSLQSMAESGLMKHGRNRVTTIFILNFVEKYDILIVMLNGFHQIIQVF